MIWVGLFFPKLSESADYQHIKKVIAQISYGYSDQIHWIKPSILVLEIQKSLLMYENASSLLTQLCKQITNLNIELRYGVAPNAMAASLMATKAKTCWNQNDLEKQLDIWSIEDLPLLSKAIDELISCGLKTVGHLKSQASDQVIRRFGMHCHQYIAQLYGEIPTIIQRWSPITDYYHRIDPTHPVETTQQLEHQTRQALMDLESWLVQNDRVLSTLIIRCKHEVLSHKNQPDLLIEIGLSQPSSDKTHLEHLIHLKLENLIIQSPLIGIIIRCQSIQNHQPPQLDLLTGKQRNHLWNDLIDRLRMRLGHEGLSNVMPCPHHQPEQSWSWCYKDDPPNIVIDIRRRPTWILSEPSPCSPNTLTLESGPERIETGWWEARFCQRDYWVASEPNGRRLWVFHEHQPRTGWFIHGIFG